MSTVVSSSGTSSSAKTFLTGADLVQLSETDPVSHEQCTKTNGLKLLAALIRDDWIEVTKKGEIVIYASYSVTCKTDKQDLLFMENLRDEAFAIQLDRQKTRSNQLYIGEINGAGMGDFDYRFLQNVYLSAILQLNVSQNLKTLFFSNYYQNDYLDDAIIRYVKKNNILTVDQQTRFDSFGARADLQKAFLRGGNLYTKTTSEVTLMSADSNSVDSGFSFSETFPAIVTPDMEAAARQAKIKDVRFYVWCITTPLAQIIPVVDAIVTKNLADLVAKGTPYKAKDASDTEVEYTDIAELRKNHGAFFRAIFLSNNDAPAGFDIDCIGHPDSTLMREYFPESAKRVSAALAAKGAAGTGAGVVKENQNMKYAGAFVAAVIVLFSVYKMMSKKSSSSSVGTVGYGRHYSRRFF